MDSIRSMVKEEFDKMRAQLQASESSILAKVQTMFVEHNGGKTERVNIEK